MSVSSSVCPQHTSNSTKGEFNLQFDNKFFGTLPCRRKPMRIVYLRNSTNEQVVHEKWGGLSSLCDVMLHFLFLVTHNQSKNTYKTCEGRCHSQCSCPMPYFLLSFFYIKHTINMYGKNRKRVLHSLRLFRSNELLLC